MRPAGAPVALLLLACGSARAAPAPSPLRALLPVPAVLEPRPGGLELAPGARVALEGRPDDRVRGGLSRFVDRLERATGVRLATEGAGPAALVVRADAEGLAVQAPDEDESYVLEVGPRRAVLRAPTPLGVLRGLETLLQLASARDGRVALPAAVVRDRPRFAWRGLLVDPARHFLPVAEVLRTLDAMASVKLNVLHWHLSDDQGFRLESRRFPRLHEVGGEGKYYSYNDVRAVVAHARSLGIRVVPELDMPGHVSSWLAAYPDLGAGPGPYRVERGFGVFDATLDPSREEVWRFVDALLGEVAELFPDAYVHVGGDEVTGREWQANAAIARFAAGRGLAGPGALQAHWNARVAALLAARGRRMAGWDEIFRPDLPAGTLLQAWRDAEPLARAAAAGFRGLRSHGYYLDHNLPAAWHYRVDPVPEGLDARAAGAVAGGEACLWGEHVDADVLDARLWPRAAAIAERLWSPARVRDEADLRRRLELHGARLDALGVRWRAPDPLRLARLADGDAAPALRTLAQLVEPVKFNLRKHYRAYDTGTLLDRLVDAVPPESEAARDFAGLVDAWLARRDAPGAGRLRERLRAWAGNHAALAPALERSERARELLPLSRSLELLAKTGLDALDRLEAGRPPPPPWAERARYRLDRAAEAQAELELAPVAAVRRLVDAAAAPRR